MAALIRARPATLLRNVQHSLRMLSTSSKKSDTAAATSAQPREPDTIDFSIESVRKSKNWLSYGFDYEDKEYDEQIFRSTMFFAFTLCLVGCSFFACYYPDPHQRDWAQREAFLVLREREAAGLNPIDPDIIDPSTVVLPSDEELGATEIII